ncbi:putative reverse transcriptase, RNA-dependent DNA polymerase, partial [Tanacetum coccineum]
MEEISLTIDEAKLKKMADEMLRQRCTSGDEHQYHIDQMKNFLQSDIVWESRKEILKGNSCPEKIVFSLHKFPAIVFNDDDIEERTSRWVNKCIKKFNPYARYGVENWKNPYAKIFYIRRQNEPGRPKEEIYSNSKILQPDYKNLNKNDIKDMYLLIMNNKVPDYANTGLLWSLSLFIRSSVIWERVHDFQLGIEHYQQKINLTAPTITFLGIEEYDVWLDMNKFGYNCVVSPIPTTRAHKDQPLEQIFRDIHSAPQTRRMTKNVTEHVEPKKVIQALQDPSWIEAMQEELLQFKLQLVWTLMDLPYGKRAIGTKWVYMNKKDERGIVTRNKARLVAQEYTQKEGIDYDEVFDPVARIEAIRLFLAYASFKDLVVYQMDVKSAFLYGKIEEEVYVCQPSGFEDPEFPDKVYKRGQIDMTLFIKRVKAITPMETSKPLLKDAEAEDVDVHLYRLMIGSLMYLTASRPDIMFVVCACDSPFNLEAYTDSDYAGASLDKKSTTGASSSCCGHVLWIQNQMLDYGYNFMNTKIFIDNESTICIVKNPVFHSKTKHIEIRHHFIRDSYEKRLIQVIKIHTDHNVADLLTKAFDVSIFQYLIATKDEIQVSAVRVTYYGLFTQVNKARVIMSSATSAVTYTFVTYRSEPAEASGEPMMRKISEEASHEVIAIGSTDSDAASKPTITDIHTRPKEPQTLKYRQVSSRSEDEPDDTNDEDEDDKDDKEEEHLAPVDSAIVVPVDEPVFPPEGIEPVIPPPSTDIAIGARITVRTQASISLPPEAEVERLLTMTTPSPSPPPPISLSPPSAGERLARCTAPHVHSPPLPPSSGCPTQIQTLRIVSTQALIDAVTAALPSPPLPPLPPSLYIPPPVDRRDDIPESEQPPRKRL